MLPIEPDNFKNDGTDLDPQVIDRIIEMAWEDRTPFEAIEMQYGLKENQVRAIMRKHMKRSSFHMWRKRVKGRSTKHQVTRNNGINRFKSANQKG
ncbi:MAG: TIGR03643 family protein [Flavobacteriales bacterium]